MSAPNVSYSASSSSDSSSASSPSTDNVMDFYSYARTMHAHTTAQLEQASRTSNRRRAGPDSDSSAQPVASMLGMGSSVASESSRGSVESRDD